MNTGGKEHTRRNYWVEKEIREALKQGIEVSVNEYRVEEDIASIVREEDDYMADYEMNEEGKIVHINYERVR